MMGALQFIRRGELVQIAQFAPDQTLLDYLRLSEKSKGTKEGCNEGDCGACTVVLGTPHHGGVRYQAVNACILLLGQIHGKELVTVDDLARGGVLHPVQQAMVDAHASQCGFCTPGFVMSLFSLKHEGRKVSRTDVVEQIAGNLCRCTGYRPIVDAGLAACNTPADYWHVAQAETCAKLEAIQGDLFVGDTHCFFAAPASADALAECCADHPTATIVSGNTDVGLWITKQMRAQPRIIYTGRANGFADIKEHDDHISIGAGATYADAEAILVALAPDLGGLLKRIGSRQVRASGTIGGNIANGSPIGDMPPALIALGATLHLRGGPYYHHMPMEEFFVAYGQQKRKPGELVWRIDIPKPKPNQIFRAYKISKRFDQDISALMAAFLLTVEDSVIQDARIAFGGMAATPKRASKTELALKGKTLTEAQHAALDDFTPLSDMRASADYRNDVANALLKKALLEAVGAANTRVLA
ncbi:MAG: xanthine dehydrogenase small subunit [Alphaproteobacteria bacterium]|nr:xanthine dehydrogenase small subunit [Alphaproteobacteria bacterium]